MPGRRVRQDLETGYEVTSELTLTMSANLQLTHDGLEFPLSREDATVALGSAMSIYGSVVWTPWGQNSHAVKGVILGTSWTFGSGMLGVFRDPASKAYADSRRAPTSRPHRFSGAR